MMDKIDGLLLSLVAVSMGGGFLFLQWRQRRKMRASADWHPVAARILQGGIRFEDGSGHYSRGYVPWVRYRYDVQGETHEGTRIHLSAPLCEQREEAESLMERYPVDATVTAFANPENPREAVLVRVRAEDEGRYSSAGIVVLGLGLAGLLWIGLSMR